MRYVELRGTPFERGRMHGEALRDVIKEKSFDILLGKRLEGKPWVNDEISELEGVLEKEFPEALDELKGIAEGAGIPYIDIFKLNFYYILGWVKKFCTYVGFVTDSGQVILGKNEDASPRELLVMFKVSMPDGTSYLMSTYAGTISASCGNGINSRGLAFAGASIGPVKTYNGTDRIPLYLLCTRMLQRFTTVQECIDDLLSTKYTGGANFLFADRTGRLAGAEIASDGKEMFHKPKNGAIYRSNHPLLPEIVDRMECNPENEPGLLNSHKRMETLDIMTASLPHNLESLKIIFKSHHPNTSICQHVHINGAVMGSDGSFIMLPSEGKILGLVGFPCENEYEEFLL